MALMHESVGRYPPQIAPFVAVESTDARNAQHLERLVSAGESVYLVGVAPPLERGWVVEAVAPIPQLICASAAAVRPGPESRVLTQANRSDMLALTALVFPGFFRQRTLEMGRYLGIYHGKVLAAMAGERMHLDGYQEISAVCTHPEFIGRGYAQRLVAQVTNSILERGLTPFLHVHRDNARALSVYQHLGFRHRADITLWSVTRERKI